MLPKLPELGLVRCWTGARARRGQAECRAAELIRSATGARARFTNNDEKVVHFWATFLRISIFVLAIQWSRRERLNLHGLRGKKNLPSNIRASARRKVRFSLFPFPLGNSHAFIK